MTISQRRLLQIFAFLAAWGVIVVGRLVHVQLIRHKYYVARAVRQQERTLSLDPVRGSILDSRGRVLAESISAESIYADPQAISDRAATAKALAAIRGLGLTEKTLSERLASHSPFIWIARQLPMEVGASVKKLKLPGIYTLEEHRRSYPRATLAANVVGYTGVDGGGLAGVEHSFDRYVHGQAGRVTLLRDARQRVYVMGGEGPNRPVNGHHTVLTIDSVIQFLAERSLARAAVKYRAAGASAIVLDPRDGSILAMASYPTFDPNRFRDFSSDAWRNRGVQDMYEPGSTFKIVTASAGLEEGIVTPSQMIDCGNGSINIGNVAIGEHGGHRYGMIAFEDVMVHSSNVGTIRLALTLGRERLYRYIRNFGFGEKTGIELPGETAGLVRRTDKWSLLSNASMAIGQEIGVTPLQVARATAIVANGGLRVEPHIVDRVIDQNKRTIYKRPRSAPGRVISEKTAAILNEILKAVVARGTGQQAALAEHVVAGKTGTAQKAVRGGYSGDKVVASFAGYVPADRPRLVIVVVVDEPRGAQYGGTIAAPVFREIAEASLRYLGVEPSIPSRSITLAPPLLAAFPQQSAPRSLAGTVPDFRGLDARAAVTRATAAGLLVVTRGSGVVHEQSPEPGGAIEAERRVVLTLTPNPAEAVR